VSNLPSVQGLDLAWCKAPDVGLPAPDAVIFLELSVEEAAKRGDYGKERYEKLDFQAKVYEQFLKLREPNWHVIDARHSVEEMQQQLKAIALSTVTGIGSRSIGALWV